VIFVDSTVWVDFFNGVDAPWTLAFRTAARTETVVVGDLVIMEVLQGFRDQQSVETALDLFTDFDIINVVDTRVAIEAARNYRALRARGITVRKTIDTLIATRCILDGYELLHRDRDFDGFQRHLGLRVVSLPAGC